MLKKFNGAMLSLGIMFTMLGLGFAGFGMYFHDAVPNSCFLAILVGVIILIIVERNMKELEKKAKTK